MYNKIILVTTIMTILLVGSIMVRASPDPFNITFETIPGLDHVEIIISVTNNQDSNDDFPFNPLLNRTSIDITKTGVKLYEWKPEEYEKTICHSCEIENCKKDNQTEQPICVNTTIKDCVICGNHTETRERFFWLERNLVSEEKNTGKTEILNRFEEVHIKKGETKRFKLHYDFGEIPINPSTNKYGSFGFVYLNVRGELFYDFEHSSWWDTSWGKCRNITIDSSLIDETLINFPLYIKLDNSTGNFTDMQDDWDDVRFVSESCGDGGSVLDYELEVGNSTESHWWVRVPSVSSGTDTVISVYYDNSDASDGSNAIGVWPDYEAVYHMKQETGTLISDSTGVYDMTKKSANEPLNISGEILDGAQNYDGSNDYSNQATLGDTWPDNLSFTVWITPTDGWSSAEGSNDYVLFKQGAATFNLYNMLFDQGTGKALTEYRGDSSNCIIFTNTTVWTASPYQIVSVYGPPETEIYINGTRENTDACTVTPAGGPANDFYYGSTHTPSSYSKIIAHEFRISSVRRSAAWIKADWYSGRSEMVTIGTEETAPPIPPPPPIPIHSFILFKLVSPEIPFIGEFLETLIFKSIIIFMDRLTVLGNVIIGGNLQVGGNVTAENVFIPAYVFAHTNTTIAVASAGTWYNVPFDEEPSVPKSRITHTHNDNTNDTFTIQDDGTYNIHYAMSFSDASPSPTSHIVMRVVKNGVEIKGSLLEEDSTKQYSDFTISNGPIVDLITGDEIKFQFASDDTDVSLTSHRTYGDHHDLGVVKIIRIA